MYIFLYNIDIYLEPICPLFCLQKKVQTPIKQGTFGFQVYIWSNYSDLTRFFTPKGSFQEGKWDPLFQENPGWWNISIWLDTYIYMYICISFLSYMNRDPDLYEPRPGPKESTWKTYNDTLLTAKTEETFLKATVFNSHRVTFLHRSILKNKFTCFSQTYWDVYGT